MRSKVHGSVMYEFALAIPLFLFITIGGYDLIWAGHINQSLDIAAQQSARVLAKNQGDVNFARNVALNYLAAAKIRNVSITIDSNANSGAAVSVTITAPLADNLLFGDPYQHFMSVSQLEATAIIQKEVDPI